MHALDFSGFNVLVTGGSNGIGLSIARAFRSAGANVTIVGTGKSADDYPHDLAEFSCRTVQREDTPAVDAMIAATDHVDVLVNAAGIAVGGGIAQTPEEFEKTISINLKAAFRLCAGLRPMLCRRRGSIINLGSMYSYFGSSWGPGYGASKSAIVGLTRALATAHAKDSIRVNAIAPGWVETNITATLRNEGRDGDILSRTPLGRWGRPDEVAAVALFLAPDRPGRLCHPYHHSGGRRLQRSLTDSGAKSGSRLRAFRSECPFPALSGISPHLARMSAMRAKRTLFGKALLCPLKPRL